MTEHNKTAKCSSDTMRFSFVGSNGANEIYVSDFSSVRDIGSTDGINGNRSFDSLVERASTTDAIG